MSRLEELEALERAATKGKWTTRDGDPRLASQTKGREGDLVRACLQLLTARGWLAWRNQSGMIRGAHKGKAWAVRMGLVGMPDVIALKACRCAGWMETADLKVRCSAHHTAILMVECKRGKAKASPHQRARHIALTAQNVRVLIVYDIRELADALA